MPITQEDLINQSLVLMGVEPLFSLDDDLPVAQSCAVLYPMVLNTAFQTDWKFARKTRKLSRVEENYDNGYTYVFELPGDMVIGSAFKALTAPQNSTEPFKDYTIEGNRLCAMYDTVYLRYSALKPPEEWPPFFREFFVHALACRLAVSLTGNASLMKSFEEVTYGLPSLHGSGGLFGKALTADARQADMPSALSVDPYLMGGW